MRSLKRLIAAFLAFVMVLTCVGITTFAANFSDITDQKVAEAVDKLVGFNIITGYEDGTFRPDNQITRAEFAAIVTRYKGIADNLGNDAVTGFADLDGDSSRAWARPYVKAAVDAKIINGFEDGTFRAGEPVTYEQAVKMLVCAAGYEVVAQSELNRIKITNPDATWSAGYISAAVKHGITKNAYTAQVTQPASRGVVAVLTSNTIDVPPLKENADGTFEKDEESESEQSTVEVTGLVAGTYLTGIDAPTVDISQKEIIIDTGDGKQTYELSAELRGKVDFEDLIGRNVAAYYDKHNRELTSISPREATVTVIKEQDVISISGDVITYYNDKGRTDSVSLAGYTKIYNGKYYPNVNLAANFKNGQIELIEDGGQRVAKITSYDVFVVQSKTFNDKEERVYFKYNKTYKGNAYYEFSVTPSLRPEVYVNGVKKEISGTLFNEWNVINLLESPDLGGNRINRMYVTSGAKTGKITEGKNDERMLVMDDKEIYLTYDYSINPDRVTEFELNSTYTYYLDYTGQIAAVNKKAATTSTKYEYGYITGADDKEVGLILKDGTHLVVAMKKNVKLDSVSTDKDEIQGKLETYAGYIGSTGCYQPVKYYISNDELVALDTIADSTGAKATTVGTNSDDTFVYNATANSVTAKTSSVTIDGTLYNLSSSTKVIYVPDTKSSTSDYSVMTPSTAFAVGTDRKIEVFGADPAERTKNATVVLMYGTDPAYTFTGKTPYMVVTKKISGGTAIEGYLEGSTTPTQISVSEEKFKAPTVNCVAA
ncbi:MAG: S-layer homology domain-containing protein, partial [Clostridia bacterium]|nr:S-layer homology domain-containing protein [Clostridia bacterium]